jgi:pilus assembly protein Flp/PilA
VPKSGAATFRHGSEVDKKRPRTSSDSHVWIKEPIMKNIVSRFVSDESGATAIEYGLIAAGISVAIIAVVQGIGTNLVTKFTAVKDGLK